MALTPANSDVFLGFGSFHFQATSYAPSQFTGSQYLESVEAALKGLDTSTVISVSSDEAAYLTAIFEAPHPFEGFSDTAVAYPFAEFWRCKFALELPLEMQRSVLGEEHALAEGDPQRFIVSMWDGWQMPLAAIWPLGATSPDHASNGVRIVREYLELELGSKGAPFRFESIGPSPAHFTVQLRVGEVFQQSEFELVDKDSRPYLNYRYACHPSVEVPAAAVDDLCFELSSQLDLLYQIEAARISQGRSWSSAEDSAREILDAYRRRGTRAAYWRLLRGRHIRRVLVQLVELELNQGLSHKLLNNEFERDYREAPGVDIEQIVSDQLSGFETIDTAPLSKLLEALDAGRQTGRAVLIAAIASLVGAVVAAVATLIAS